MEIKIGNKTISENGSPFIIAEAGVNYYELAKKDNVYPIDSAKLMVKCAAESGADAIKFQTYKAEKLASRFSPAYWDTSKEKSQSQYSLFARYDLFGEEEYAELAKFATNNGIIFLSTPFDQESANFLNELMPAYKISSSDITNIPFLRDIAQKKKPIILSTGASTFEEIHKAKHVIENEGNNQLALLHCVLSYPTKYDDANLRRIISLKKEFPENIIGYSDHTKPDANMLVLTTSFLCGAQIIEKHFTLDKQIPGNDHYHSMDPNDLRIFTENVRFIQRILGKGDSPLIDSEKQARKYARRSIFAEIDIPKGTEIKKEMLILKRPGTGISPEFLDLLIGKKILRAVKKDTPLTWADVESDK